MVTKASSSETAICLLTEAVMQSGSARRSYTRTARPAGACTLFAREVKKITSLRIGKLVRHSTWQRGSWFALWSTFLFE